MTGETVNWIGAACNLGTSMILFWRLHMVKEGERKNEATRMLLDSQFFKAYEAGLHAMKKNDGQLCLFGCGAQGAHNCEWKEEKS